MIVGPDLEAWLADRPRQRRTQAAIDDFAKDWRSGPVHRRFDDALVKIPDQSAEAIAEAMRELFADHGWVDGLIDSLAAACARDPFFDPPFRAISSDVHNGLLVFEDPRVSIAVGVSTAARLAAKKSGRRGPTSVGFTGQLTVLKFVHAGDAALSLWEAPPVTADFAAASAGTCVRTGERRLADGDILTIDGRCQTYVIEAARANLFVLQASIALDQAPLSVEYDSASLAFVGCSATDDGASRIQMIATLLRKLDCGAAFDALVPFLDHPDFFVRWHVMRELLGLDASAALPHLRRMAETDPHPDPRRTARIVLDRFDEAA
jgi:HEAT repeats